MAEQLRGAGTSVTGEVELQGVAGLEGEGLSGEHLWRKARSFETEDFACLVTVHYAIANTSADEPKADAFLDSFRFE